MPAGRPTLYSDELREEIVKNCRKGLGSGTNKEIAAFCCVNESTVYRWKQKHPELEAEIQKVNGSNCDLVEGTLLHLAISGDMTAVQFYLKNRRPEKWREKKELDVRTSDGGTQLNYSVEEIDRLANLPQEDKLELARTARAHHAVLVRLHLRAQESIDAEAEEDSEQETDSEAT
jgi:hypothetical protein